MYAFQSVVKPLLGKDEESTWQQQLARSYRSLDELVSAGLFSTEEAHQFSAQAQAFQLQVPRFYAHLMDTSLGASCPIRRQALPGLQERDPALPLWAKQWSQKVYGQPMPWSHDPIGDVEKLAAARLTHRYRNRVLMHVAAACALYCRFCFRKNHLQEREVALYKGSMKPALAYIAAHSEIREVILTGGDPLSLSDTWLKRLFDELQSIAHVAHIRIHSRMPVTLPARLNASLRDVLTESRLNISLVSHFNHPRELTEKSLQALSLFRQAGVVLYNQTVLMKDINDEVDVLMNLFSSLYEQGITPFYLHHPDWAAHTFGFRLSVEKGQELMRHLQGALPGPALPRYVLDLPGGGGKIDLMTDAIRLLKKRSTPDLSGALYRVRTPVTRHGSFCEQLYVNLWS